MRAASTYSHAGFRPRTSARADTLASIALDVAALASLLAGIWAAAHAWWGL